MRRLAIALLLVMASLPASSQAAIDFKGCGAGIQCGRLSVPLDHSGRTPGTLSLYLERVPSAAQRQGAVVALAGGPGESATPFTFDFAQELEPALETRDLIVLDQRGTGRSGLLRCPRLEREYNSPSPPAIDECVRSLGPRRPFYTTADSADDIESIRQAIGVDKLTLEGTSYGTKVALTYAQRYPTHVEKLILDSLVPLDGPDAFSRDIFTGVPRVLRSICNRGHCKQITSDPVADLATLVSRMHTPIRGRVISARGRAKPAEVGKLSLLNILVDGDLDPTLQAEFPTAVRAAVQGDAAPLLRLAHRHNQSQQLPESPRLFSKALNWTTVCEELSFPWDSSASLPDRWGMAMAEASRIPDAAFFPFDRATAQSADENRTCVRWPDSGRKQLPTGPLPDVPTLILSGERDLRTAAEGAASVLAQSPHATQVIVPRVGHSVAQSDPTPCATRALRRFLRGLPVAPACPHLEDLPVPKLLESVRGILVQELFSPPPIPPASLKQVTPIRHVPGRAARTLAAVELTISDVLRQAFYASVSLNEPAFGGLRGGRMRSNGTLDHYSYVPGVAISLKRRGHRLTLPGDRLVERVRVSGHAAARGWLVFNTSRDLISGRLGGKRVRVRLTSELTRLLPVPQTLTFIARAARRGLRLSAAHKHLLPLPAFQPR